MQKRESQHTVESCFLISPSPSQPVIFLDGESDPLRCDHVARHASVQRAPASRGKSCPSPYNLMRRKLKTFPRLSVVFNSILPFPNPHPLSNEATPSPAFKVRNSNRSPRTMADQCPLLACHSLLRADPNSPCFIARPRARTLQKRDDRRPCKERRRQCQAKARG